MGLFITFILGIFLFAGAVIARSVKDTELIEHLSISIGFGTMLALGIMEILPEALENLEGASILTLPVCLALGVAILKLLDHFVPEHDHAHGLHHDCTEENVIHIGVVSSVAVILHNIIEGMAVYSMAQDSLRVGLLMALGVGLHNIPMGMVIYTTLQKEKRTPKLILLAATTFSTFIGGLLMMFFWGSVSERVIGILMCLALGMLVYIVFFELLPHMLHGEDKKLSLTGALLGVGIICISLLFG
ncbi:MAG: ZIP family metal transporter [Clostridiales bacterium]|nr:ZIP family metal transporter [Candidatus Blautia equi]